MATSHKGETTMTNKQKNFNIGYKQAITGNSYNTELSKYPGYDEGFDAGHCDRPTLDDLMPLDVAKESNRWYI
jgi:hypothetical protein